MKQTSKQTKSHKSSQHDAPPNLQRLEQWARGYGGCGGGLACTAKRSTLSSLFQKIMRLCVLFAGISVYLVCTYLVPFETRKRCWTPQDWNHRQLWVVMRVVGNQIQVLWKRSQCFNLLNHLSSLSYRKDFSGWRNDSIVKSTHLLRLLFLTLTFSVNGLSNCSNRAHTINF